MSGWTSLALRLAGLKPSGSLGLVSLTDDDRLKSESKILEGSVVAKSLLHSSSGDVPLVTPAAGKRIKLSYYYMGANPDNSGHVVVGLKWGVSGDYFIRAPLSKYGASAAHSFKSGRSFIIGEIDQILYGNLSSAQSVYFNLDYEEV